MKIVLTAGVNHKTFASVIAKYETLVNLKTKLTLGVTAEYLRECKIPYDRIIITDGGLSSNTSDNERLLKEICADLPDGVRVFVITRDFYLKVMANGSPVDFQKIKFISSEYFRISEADICKALENSKGGAYVKESVVPQMREDVKETANMEENGKPSRGLRLKKGWIKSNNEVDTDESGHNIRKSESRAIAFTGKEGSGVTSTLINLAVAASEKGIRTIILDFDIDYRAINLYFNKFCSLAEESEDICRSLIMTLANPRDYMTSCVPINDDLWVTSLGYDFNDEGSIEKFFTDQKISRLISSLKSKFDLIFVDFPIRHMSLFPGVLSHFNSFCLCIENSLYAVVTLLRALNNNFSSEDVQYLNVKSKLVVTKYNDEAMYDDEILTPENIENLLTGGMCEDFVENLAISGSVPYLKDYGRQIETDVPFYHTNSLMRKSFNEILSRL